MQVVPWLLVSPRRSLCCSLCLQRRPGPVAFPAVSRSGGGSAGPRHCPAAACLGAAAHSQQPCGGSKRFGGSSRCCRPRDVGLGADPARGDLGRGRTPSRGSFQPGPCTAGCWHSAHYPVICGVFFPPPPSISKCAFNQMLLKKRGRFVCYLNAIFLISTILIICHFW